MFLLIKKKIIVELQDLACQMRKIEVIYKDSAIFTPKLTTEMLKNFKF